MMKNKNYIKHINHDVKKGKTVDQSIKKLEAELRARDTEIAEEDEGKCFGACESCGMETVLVEDVGLCGPCCFGEAETINGNW